MARWYDPDGTQRKQRGFLTQEEADRYRTAAQKNTHDGLVTDPAEGETLLRDLAVHHLEVHTSRGRPLSPKTLGPMRGLLNRNIIGNDTHRKRHHLGGYPLNKITVEVVDDWYAKVRKDAGADQAAKSYKLLKTMLNRAVRYRWIPFNPCQIEGGSQEHAAERPIPDDDDVVQALADAMSHLGHGDRYKAMVLVNGFGAAARTEGIGRHPSSGCQQAQPLGQDHGDQERGSSANDLPTGSGLGRVDGTHGHLHADWQSGQAGRLGLRCPPRWPPGPATLLRGLGEGQGEGRR